MDGEENEQVPEEGDLEGESGVAGNTDYVCEIRGEEGNDKHDIGHPEVDMVEEEVTKSLTENRVQLQPSRVLHHPGDEVLQLPDKPVHAQVDGVYQGWVWHRRPEHQPTKE